MSHNVRRKQEKEEGRGEANKWGVKDREATRDQRDKKKRRFEGRKKKQH